MVEAQYVGGRRPGFTVAGNRAYCIKWGSIQVLDEKIEGGDV